MPGSSKLTSFDEVGAALDALEKSPDPKLEGPWSIAQVLIHCAQSIEYSLTGYPTAKSVLFQKTIGRLVLRRFLSRGAMSHGLAAPIPEAPELPAGATLSEGLARLRQAVASFRAHRGEPAPHFAYGPVSRADYEKVHAMHVANHLSAVDF